MPIVAELLEPRRFLTGVSNALLVWHATTTAPSALSDRAVAVGDEAVFAEGLVYHAATGAWSQRLQTPSHYESSAVAVDGKALFAGGFQAGTFRTSDAVDIYDSNTGGWSQATLSEARLGVFAVAVGDDALFAGGWVNPAGDGGGTWTDLVDIFNTRTNNWSTAMLSQRDPPAVATVGDQAVFYSDGKADIFNADTSTWSTVSLSEESLEPLAAVVNGQAIFAGGAYLPGYPGSDVANIYNSITDSWSTSTFPNPRLFSTAVAVDGDAIFAGGLEMSQPFYYSGPASDLVDIYHTSTGAWSTTRLSQPRFDAAAVSIGNSAFFGGGNPFLGNTTSTRTVDVYDALHHVWTNSQLSNPRAYAAALAVGGTAMFAGDSENTAHLNVADLFKTTSLQTTTARSARGHLRVTLSNTGGVAVPRGYSVRVYASANAHDRGAVLLGSATVSSDLAANQSQAFDLWISLRGRLNLGSRSHLTVMIVPSSRGHGIVVANDRDAFVAK